MTTSIALNKFSAPLAAPASEHVDESHPRFMQIMARLNGTHPDVKVGQVWEDINPDNLFRRILVTEVREDGITAGVTVWVNNSPDHEDVSIGEKVEIPTYSFRVDSDKSGFRLRGVYVSLDDAGVPHNVDSVPVRKPLSSMVKVTPRKKATTTTTAPKSIGGNVPAPTPKSIGGSAPTPNPQQGVQQPSAAPKSLPAANGTLPVSKEQEVRSSFPAQMPKPSNVTKENVAHGVKDTPLLDQVLSLLPSAKDSVNTATPTWLSEPRAMKVRDEIARIISPRSDRTKNTRPSVFQNMVARIALEELGIDLAKKWAQGNVNTVPENGTEAELHPFRQSARDFKVVMEAATSQTPKELVSAS